MSTDREPPHAHEWAQFSYRLEGMAAVRAGEASIVLPPGRGVWIPLGTVHEVSCRGPAAYNALYVTTNARPFPTELKVLNVSPFLHALVEEFLTFATEYDEAGREGAVVALMLGEIDRAPWRRGRSGPAIRDWCGSARRYVWIWPTTATSTPGRRWWA